jgi:hypothetical protein
MATKYRNAHQERGDLTSPVIYLENKQFGRVESWFLDGEDMGTYDNAVKEAAEKGLATAWKRTQVGNWIPSDDGVHQTPCLTLITRDWYTRYCNRVAVEDGLCKMHLNAKNKREENYRIRREKFNATHQQQRADDANFKVAKELAEQCGFVVKQGGSGVVLDYETATTLFAELLAYRQ